MANYLLQFGTGNPSSYSGLAPTFITFKTIPGGTNVTPPPGITEIPTATGLYYFTFGATTSVIFTVDGATTGLSDPIRYISGEVSALDQLDVNLAAQGATLVAIGNSLSVFGSSFASLNALIGTSASSFGDSTTNPGTVFGFLKRLQEFNEGNATFTKSSGFWSIYSRGSSYLLAQKTLADTATNVTKL